MSLAIRLKQIEQRSAELGERCAALEQFNTDLINASVQEPDDEPAAVTLDGECIGASRGQNASLG